MPENLLAIYQLEIRLNHIKPTIWRRLMVPNTIDLFELHLVLQDTMGWMDCHLHQFILDGSRNGTPNPDYDDDTIDELDVRVRSVLKQPGDSIIYEYDFGDGWEHIVTLEKILPYSKDVHLPKCLAGERSCPPEDVGGPWGYKDFLNAFNDKNHPEHDNIVEWAGEDFQPEICNIKEINELFEA
jgi:hypothetical protein